MTALQGLIVAVVLGAVVGVGSVLSVSSMAGDVVPRGVPVAQVLDYGAR